MMRDHLRNRFRGACALSLLVVGAALAAPPPVSAQQPLYLQDFSQGAPQGFNDPANTFARSMQWWNGRLYVGIQRAYACTQAAILARYNPFIKYPPIDPTLSCAPDPADLPMRAEIWRWTPPDAASPADPGTWERVYQSPQDVPIPGTNPVKFVPREIGFRDMAVFTEADGTQALYVSGTSARGFLAVNPDFTPGLPPPRILRSSDGNTFTEVPSDPGTVLGSLSVIENINISSFNRMTVYNGKLYVIAGGDFGHGVIFESANPSGGNDNFRLVSGPGQTFTYMEPFNGKLYVAQGAQPVSGVPPYAILKTDATGTPPFAFTTVMTGLRLPSFYSKNSSQSIANMHAVGNALWIGSNQPPELVRINPDDTWDLYMGQPRQLADGTWKYPRTGMGDGFDWYFAIHIHRMQEHNGFLYLASNDEANTLTARNNATMNTLFSPRYGFDLFRTKNGWYMNPITQSGFEDKDPGGHNNWFNYTGRTAQSTPFGLFIGTGNDQFGEQIWRGLSIGPAAVPPDLLEGESVATGNVLSWLPSPTAVKYHIFRADYYYSFQLGVPFYIGGSTYPMPFVEVGTSTNTLYSDPAAPGVANQYYVVAEDALGNLSGPSNLTRVPSLGEKITFGGLKTTFTTWQASNELAAAALTQITTALQQAQQLVYLNQYTNAEAVLQGIKAAALPPAIVPWRVDDLNVLLTKMQRRLELARQGAIPKWMVVF